MSVLIKRKKTVLFEEKYDVDITSFSATEEIDKLIAAKEGLDELEIVSLDGGIVDNRGNILPILDVDIDSLFDKTFMKKRCIP